MSNLRLIYDLTSQPLSCDILEYSLMGMAICKERGHDGIDFIFTYDPLNPVQKVPAFAHITPENFQSHLSKYIPLAKASQLVKSVEILTHEQMRNLQYQDAWPHKIDVPYQYLNIRTHLNEHFAEYGFVPSFEITDPFQNKFGEYVSVNLRRNMRNPGRNSDYDAWLEFFKNTDDNFVVVCESDEIDDRMRLPNVIFAKDYGTNLLQDVAICLHSKLHMGASSGPATAVLFSQQNYAFFNVGNAISVVYEPLYKIKDGLAYMRWANDKQFINIAKETPEILSQSYMRIQ